MDLNFNLTLAERYKNNSQKARVLTEEWLSRNMYCPVCGNPIIRHAEPNAPVKDYVCDNCKAQFELKSKHSTDDKFNSSVNDGVYKTMIQRITSLENPSFFFLHYDHDRVNNLIIVPRSFFVPGMIEERRPLGMDAQRHGWTGCNIIMKNIPATAKIEIIVNGEERPKEQVLSEYNKVYNLQSKTINGRGWIVDIIKCMERLGNQFTLQDMYDFTDELTLLHPENHRIKEKIRQQMQILRDKGIIEFEGNGRYRKIFNEYPQSSK